MDTRDHLAMNRRGVLKTSAAMLGGAMLGSSAEPSAGEQIQSNVNTNSSPSELKITDMRYCSIKMPGSSPCPIIRIDTNQGVYGLGEVRDRGGVNYALELKSRIVGLNPLNIDFIFQKIDQFGSTARQAGGVVAIEIALWDIAGKVFNCPIYQMLGGRWRDKVRCYNTVAGANAGPKGYGDILKSHIENYGMTWLKINVGTGVLRGIPGTLTQPSGQTRWELTEQPAPFLATEITDKGIEHMSEYLAAIREAVGMEIPISIDHLGHISVHSVIRLGQAFQKYNLEWMEDVIPWQYTELLKYIHSLSPTPILTGEDIYREEDFEKLCVEHAVSKIHPDLESSGGILRTKRIGDMAFKHGVPMAIHNQSTPVGYMAAVHCAAATRNFLALESHDLEASWWDDLVEGIEKPIRNKGYVSLPQKGGLGFTLNEEVAKQHLQPGTSYFAPTTEWDEVQSYDDQLWS